jgi:hypothetical protein
MKQRFVIGLFILSVVVFGLLTSFQVVQAQDPTPDPTATPGYISEIELEPGVSFIVVRQFSYGDMAIVASMLIVLVVVLVSAFTVVVSRIIRN